MALDLSSAPPSYRLIEDPDSWLFPQDAPRQEGFLPTESHHRLWFQEFGNPQGFPVIAIHGGPGAGCSPREAQFFDPSFYRIILLDQRGAGRSLPSASTEANTTHHLIADMERLRCHLNIDRWLLFGGSWGSALA